MGDVNFLAKDNKDDEKKDGKKEEIKWSDGKEQKKENVDAKGENEKIEGKNSGVKDADISSWLNSLKEGKEIEGKGVKELKKSKEALVEYQQVLKKEKKGAELKKGMKKLVEDGEIKEKPQGGIADIIKNKLSFGGGDKKEEEVTLKTNLIKSEGVTFFDWKEKAKVVTINLLLTFLIVGTAYGYLEYKERGISKKSDALIDAIDELKKEIEVVEKEVKAVDKFQRKVKIVNDLLDNHIYWSNYFTFLEENLLTSVYLDSSFEGDISGVSDLASKSKNYTDLTNQSRILRQREGVLKVKIESGESVSSGEGKEQEVEFTINLEVEPSIYYK